ncbi:MAG: hypothetical protein ACOC0U_02225 [Desulfovibrionales bacterium]
MTYSTYFPDKRHAGRLWKLGHGVSTDHLHPAKYFSLDQEIVNKGLFRGMEGDLADCFAPGDILVAGRNFGCGSSREVCTRAMAGRGVAAVLAVSCARIFFRNMINTGILVIDGLPEETYEAVRTGEHGTIDLGDGFLLTEEGKLPIPVPEKSLLENTIRTVLTMGIHHEV